MTAVRLSARSPSVEVEDSPRVVEALDEYAADIRRHMEARKAVPRGAFLDIAYRDVVEDEAGVLNRVYDHCGIPLTKRALDAMQSWSAVNEQHKHGQHVYSLEEAGFTKQRIDDAFAAYIGAFGAYMDR